MSLAALIIGILSILIASFALGWNIYRDIVLKPRVKVSFIVGEIVTPPNQRRPTKLNISAVNFGPGKVTLSGLILKRKSILRKTEYAYLIRDWRDHLSAQLPSELDVGEEKNFFLPFNRDCLLREKFTYVGIRDSFGRIHWAPRKHFKEAEEIYKKQYVKDRNRNH